MNESKQTPFLTRLGGHFPALDGVRGLAILLVVVLHFRDFTTRAVTAGDRLFMSFASAGWIGVDLFFVLSGFLITGILLDARGAPHYFKNFYMRRALRIFPLYYAVLAVYVLGLPLIERGGSPELQELLSQQGWYWAYLTNVHAARHVGAAAPYGLGHFWSLAIEEQFYLVWPMVVYFTPVRWLQRVCVALIACGIALRAALSVGGAHPMVAYLLTPTHMGGLLMGAYLAVEIRKPKGRALVAASWKPIAAIGGVCLLFLIEQMGQLRWEPRIGNLASFSVLGLFFAAVVGGAVVAPKESPLSRVLANPVLRSFGKYSYAIYVFHNLLAYWMHRAGFGVADLPTVGGSHLPARLLYILLGTTLSYAVAVASWHLLEKRFLALKDRFPYAAPRAAGAAAVAPRPVRATASSTISVP